MRTNGRSGKKRVGVCAGVAASERDRWGILLAVVLPAALYWNTLRHGFVYDDLVGIIQNPLIVAAARIRDLWPILAQPWRPLVQWSYAATHVYFGFSPTAYHAGNVALHAANAVLVFAIARELARCWLRPEERAVFAWSAALLFAVHPIHTEAVAYVWGRSSSLCGLFYFGSILLVILGHREDAGRKQRFLFACALAAGLLAWKAKEEAITLPFVIAGFLWLMRKDLAAAAAALVPIGVIALRWSDLAGLAGKLAGNQELVAAGANPVLPRAVYFMTGVENSVFYYLWKFLVPADLNVDPCVEPVLKFYEPRLLVACFVLGSAGAAAIAFRRSHPALCFGLVALLASPMTSYTCMPLADVVAEHRVYITGLGIALLGAWFASLKPATGAVGLAAVVAAMSIATVERNRVWASSETLWRDAEQKSPGLARPHLNLGVALHAAGRYDEALAEYEHALSVNPRLAVAYSNMSSIRVQQGELAAAENLLNKAIELSPGRVGPYISLAGVRLKRGAPEEALRVLDQAPGAGDSAAVHLSRGEALMALSRYNEARTEYGRALALSAGSAELERHVASRIREIGSRTGASPVTP
jgi:protein O-mannosyl-transferase